ncbi:thermonuclease family protein [Alicyclobacillus kakegawensis]|uniref:thermonuclease family protein n=1 Tax=Alicyclobacillus kakegawensis TaxID=392012 RepID=UPI00082B06CE|nr:thermonuclease family protein [Alicyclobacillus kakegawensis]
MGIASRLFHKQNHARATRRWLMRCAAVCLSAAVASGCAASPASSAGNAATSSSMATTQTARQSSDPHASQGSQSAHPHEASATHQNPAKASSNTSSHQTATSVPKELVPAVVSRDVDGDTIHVRLNGKDETVRMLLIDTPEDVDPVKPVEPYGQTAADYAKSRLPVGKHIYLQEGHKGYTRDKYGRLLAYVYITPHDMYNEDVVRKGYARVAYIYPPNTDHLSALESDQAYAKAHHLGIWSIKGYVTESGYNLSIACSWAEAHHESTRGCSGQASSATASSSAYSSVSNIKNGTKSASTSKTSGLSIVSSHLSVHRGQKASITVRTKPKALGTIEVDYKSGPSKAKGLGPKYANASGLISWTWTVGTNTTRGSWPVIIRANGKTLRTYVHVS